MEEVISFNEFELDQIIAGLREELQKDFQCKKKGEGGGLGSYKPRQNQIPEDESSPAQKKHKKIDELPSAKKIPKRSYENTIDDLPSFKRTKRHELKETQDQTSNIIDDRFLIEKLQLYNIITDTSNPKLIMDKINKTERDKRNTSSELLFTTLKVLILEWIDQVYTKGFCNCNHIEIKILLSIFEQLIYEKSFTEHDEQTNSDVIKYSRSLKNEIKTVDDIFNAFSKALSSEEINKHEFYHLTNLKDYKVGLIKKNHGCFNIYIFPLKYKNCLFDISHCFEINAVYIKYFKPAKPAKIADKSIIPGVFNKSIYRIGSEPMKFIKDTDSKFNVHITMFQGEEGAHFTTGFKGKKIFWKNATSILYLYIALKYYTKRSDVSETEKENINRINELILYYVKNYYLLKELPESEKPSINEYKGGEIKLIKSIMKRLNI